MEVVGTVKVIGETQSFGANGFLKRELVVTTADQYPQDILIEFVQDKTLLLDSYEVGDELKVGINLRGREWINNEGVAKYFNSVQGWKIDKLQNNAPEETPEETQDDLPF